jgi:hypothetical protein
MNAKCPFFSGNFVGKKRTKKRIHGREKGLFDRKKGRFCHKRAGKEGKAR